MKLKLKRNNTPRNIRWAAFLLCFFMMFRYILGEAGIAVLAVIVFLFALSSKIRFALDKSDFFWIYYAVIMLSFGILRDNEVIVIKRFLTLLLMIALKVLIQGSGQNWLTKSIKTILIMGGIHMSGVLIELINPAFIYRIRDTLGIESVLELGRSQVYRSGFTGQPGIAGFCLVFFVCTCVVSLIMSDNRKKLYLLLSLIGIVTVMVTGKRALFIFSIICTYITCFADYVIVQRRGMRLFILPIFVIVALMLAAKLPFFSANIDRLLHGNDAGRFLIYRFLIRNFWSSPIIGVGRDAYTSVMNKDAHNEFLRVLSENGLVGFVPFFGAVAIPFTEIICAIFKYRDFINSCILKMHKRIATALFLSLFWQGLIIMYSMTGNPLSTIEQTASYFALAAIGISAVREMRKLYNENYNPLTTSFSEVV